MRDTVVRPLKRPLKGRREVEALIGERKYHTFDVRIVIFLQIIFKKCFTFGNYLYEAQKELLGGNTI